MINTALALQLLHDWAVHSEKYWVDAPDGTGFYGTGFNSWGVQTNQKYFGALALLATHPDSRADRTWAKNRALAALRFSLNSHHSGAGRCSDGTQWGHTWISALGIERMMFGVHQLRDELTDEDRAALRRVLNSEAEYLLEGYARGPHAEITGGLWNDSGRNVPESNLWNGALLWRNVVLFPEHPRAAEWRERAHRFLINAVSVPNDAQNETIVAGLPVRERFAGANFFPHYALDHHGYLNVGYMVICTSNAAMLHFDLKAAGHARPESLDHHQAGLWQVVRRLIFANGRLARIGGDTRVRYAYCQEYLLPALLYAADQLGEEHATELVAAQLQLIAQEAEYSADGSFYGKRLAKLEVENPYYYTRLESDRACCLAMLLAYAPLTKKAPTPPQNFETSVAGDWCEPEHGAVLHRSATRFASFAWRSHGLTQGLCLPPADGHFAEWQQNLSSVVRFLGDSGEIGHRQVLRHHIETFEGGFATIGEVAEGMNLLVAEGWRGTDTARHQLAFVALPDGHTVVGLEYCRAAAKRCYLTELKGLHCALSNDLYNGGERRIVTAGGEVVLHAPAGGNEIAPLGGRWANIEGRVGVVGAYGARELVLHRVAHRRGGKFESLFTEEICFPCEIGTRAVQPDEVLLDIGWAVIASADAAQTARVAADVQPFAVGDARGLRVPGQDGNVYGVVCNFGAQPVEIEEAGIRCALEPGRVAMQLID